MNFRQTITFEQYRHACQAVVSAKTNQVKRRSWKEYLVVIILGFVLALAPQVPVARVPVFTICAVMILCWIFLRPVAKWSQGKCLKAFYFEEQEKLNSQVFTIDESGISCDEGNGQATSHRTWQSFIKRIDMPDAFVFLPSPNSFIRVPKEMLELSDRELIWEWSATVPTVNVR
jgi:hypothetical protein